MTVLPPDEDRPEPRERGGAAAPWRPSDPRLDACELMDRNTMRATTHLVAHSLRELDGGIRAVQVSMLDDAQRALVAAASLTHKAEIYEISALLFGSDGEEVAREWWTYASRLHELTHRHSLRSPRPVDDEFRQWWALAQAVIHRVSRQYETVYAEAMPRIDALAAKADPTDADLSELRERVHSAVALDRFFAAAMPDWFGLLRDAGYFADPPPLQPDEEGRVAFVSWPQGQYLARLAGDAQLRAEVVLLAQALDTDNPDAHQAVVDIALASPPEAAAELAVKVAEFLRMPYQWRLPFKTRDLVVHLIEGGQVAAALGLLRPLVVPVGRQGDQWRSTSLLRELVPQLFPAAGVVGLELLAVLLDQQLESDDRTRTRDYSYIWRPALEGGRRGDFRDTLLTALRDGAALVVENGRARLSEVVAAFEERERSIFARLALDLLRRIPDEALIAERLGDRARFDDINLEHEYDLLARERFGDLPGEVRRRSSRSARSSSGSVSRNRSSRTTSPVCAGAASSRPGASTERSTTGSPTSALPRWSISPIPCSTTMRSTSPPAAGSRAREQDSRPSRLRRGRAPRRRLRRDPALARPGLGLAGLAVIGGVALVRGRRTHLVLAHRPGFGDWTAANPNQHCRVQPMRAHATHANIGPNPRATGRNDQWDA